MYVKPVGNKKEERKRRKPHPPKTHSIPASPGQNGSSLAPTTIPPPCIHNKIPLYTSSSSPSSSSSSSPSSSLSNTLPLSLLWALLLFFFFFIIIIFFFFFFVVFFPTTFTRIGPAGRAQLSESPPSCTHRGTIISLTSSIFSSFSFFSKISIPRSVFLSRWGWIALWNRFGSQFCPSISNR